MSRSYLILLIGLATLLGVIVFSGPRAQSEKEVQLVSPAGEKILSERVLFKRRLLAASGDRKAALDVAAHYASLSSEPANARSWLVVAAENGEPVAMHLLSGELLMEGGRINCERALFWLERLAKEQEYVAGYPQAGFIERERKAIRAEERCQWAE
jgi:TPR repeat protein